MPDPNEYPCPLGYFCVEGSPSPQICPSGTYQDEMRSSACKECPAGFYCDNALAAVVNYTLFECPEGLLVFTFSVLLHTYHENIWTICVFQTLKSVVDFISCQSANVTNFVKKHCR